MRNRDEIKNLNNPLNKLFSSICEYSMKSQIKTEKIMKNVNTKFNKKFKDSGENLELSLDDIFSMANTVTDKTDYSELLKPFMSLFDNLLK